ncbi:MAG: hypothetical protein LBQ24_02410 [Candidatus Peribacteria bacterium]|jgi:hypothetical protein|nr:hypothetical protein [Candidatus Peribacteria bacterium]
MTKSWNWKREYVNKLSFTKVAIKYADGDNTQILDYNETYKAYYNGSYAVQIYSTCVARTGNMCSGNSSTVAW